MRKLINSPLLPLLFYMLVFMLDSRVTTYGISNNLGTEGDPIVVILWGIFGKDSSFLGLAYIAIIFTASLIIYKNFSKLIGLLIPYIFAVGHIIGFSTWVLLSNREFNSMLLYKIHIFLIPYGVFIVAPVIGFILAVIHKKVINS